MNEAAPNFEMLLREALTPVDPPEDLAKRLEQTLTSLTELAAGELESWELSAMRNPRNWVRPAAAVVVGTTAGAALLLLRVRQRQQQRQSERERWRPSSLAGVRSSAERALRDVGEEARKLFGER
jgi:hypothetical protein